MHAAIAWRAGGYSDAQINPTACAGSGGYVLFPGNRSTSRQAAQRVLAWLDSRGLRRSLFMAANESARGRR